MDTKAVAQRIIDDVTFAKRAHIDSGITPSDMVRFHDHSTPYIVHPIWCAMTIMTETMLEEALRLDGYQALMWHDVLEDTNATLPSNTSTRVSGLIRAMTFARFSEEKTQLFEQEPIIRLLKLYDKTSNLLDGSHMSLSKWNAYVEFAQLLIVDVENHFGELNIVKIARAIAICK